MTTLHRLKTLLLQTAADPAALDSLPAHEIRSLFSELAPPERALHLQALPAIWHAGPPVKIPGVEWRRDAYRACTQDDVLKVIDAARKAGRRVRAVGSRHSVHDAVHPSSNRDLRLALDGDLARVTFVSKDADGATVLVGGGCYLGRNPEDPLSKEATSLCGILEAAGYALPILGGITHQTLAGFLQTSSAGGSLSHGFHDSVLAIEIVDGTGTVQWHTLGSDAFAAGGVSMGLFGVVTRVLLSAVPSYFVRGAQTSVEVGDSLLQKAGGQYPLGEALVSEEYLHLNWFPQPRVKRVSQWVGAHNPVPPSVPDEWDSGLKDDWMNIVAAAVLFITGVLQLAPESPEAQAIIGALLKKFVDTSKPPETFDDRWLTVLPSDNQVRVDSLIKLVMTEIWLPTSQIGATLDRLTTMLETQAMAGNFAVELYGAKQSPFWMSPAHEGDVVRVDVFWWAYNVGNPLTHFGHFWDTLLELPGARLHWGKQLPEVGQRYGSVEFGPDLLRHRYSRMNDWLALRAQFDPERLFVSDYWVDVLGL